MESLEEVLRKVERLDGDLSAEVVIQEEKGHYERRCIARPGIDYDPKTWIHYGDGPQEENEWVVDKPKIKKLIKLLEEIENGRK